MKSLSNNTPRVTKNAAEGRKQLTQAQYHVTRGHGTERAFTGLYWGVKELGACAAR